MPTLKVPEPYRAGLQLLVGLSDDVCMRLQEVLQNAQLTLRQEDFTTSVTTQVSGIQADEAMEIVVSLLAIYAVREFLGLTIEEFAEQISDSKDLDLQEKDRLRLRDRLIDLLKIKSLLVVSKALGVVTEQDHVLHDARILTDVRPIFGDSATDPPAAAVIMHTLKILFHQGPRGELNEFFVVVNPSELQMLRGLIDRAEAKALSLQAMLENARVPHLESGRG